MAEDSSRQSQFGYKNNSNLVLTVERRTRESGPTGEVESLASTDPRQLMRQMGTRSQHRALKPSTNGVAASNEDVDARSRRANKKAGAGSGHSVLTAPSYSFYEPRTAETRRAHEALLSQMSGLMPGQSHEVLRSAADEVIAVLRSSTPSKRRPELVDLLARDIDDDTFRKMFAVAERLHDFSADQENANEEAMHENGIDEELGVAVVFDENDDGRDVGHKLHNEVEDVESDIDEVLESEEDEDEEMEDGTHDPNKPELGSKLDVAEDTAETSNLIDPKDVDAYWLQRQVKALGDKDARQGVALAEEVLQVLSSDKDARQVENAVVRLIGFEHFAFVKRLLHNRQLVVHCTRLQRAKNEHERNAVKDAMFARPELRPILDALQRTRGTAAAREKDRERKMLKEARSLKPVEGTTEQEENVQMSTAGRKPGALLDLDGLSFGKEGGHFMANSEWTLPPNSWKKEHSGYQEIFVPPPAKPARSKDALVKITSMPEWAQVAFEGYDTLNAVQSVLYRAAMLSAENLLLCAPTGAGKTNVAMIAVLRELGMHRDESGAVQLDAFKVVYVAPMKSLVREMVMTFSKRLKPFGVRVMELSGDTQLSREQLRDTQILVTTPEKWDIVTRKTGYASISSLVSLIIIDEIHLLHDSRGPVLEAIVARTVRQIEETRDMTRLVGLSATLPNYEDVAALLRVHTDNGLFVFDQSARPCPLQQRYVGVTAKRPFKQFQQMNELCYEHVAQQAGKNQIIVFVHSRKDTVTTARLLRERAAENDMLGRFVREDSASRGVLASEAENCTSPELRELLPFGFGVHHAGMVKSDRSLVEDLFTEGHLQVLVSTATLAWGVNLPAHSVLIKGTQVYSPELGRWTELSMLDVMQMLGRAGRPQFDTFGEGTILTTHVELKYYMSLLNQQLPVESQLLSCLPDLLNAEIVLGTVRNVRDAVDWLAYTYLYVRMLRAPTLYGVDERELEEDPALEQRRLDLIHTAATTLDRAGLLRYDRKSGALRATDLGRVASHYYLTHRSMSTFNAHLKPLMSELVLLRVFALSDEFKQLSVRQEEKAELAKLLDKVPLPVKEALDEPSAKINILLQAYISRLALDGFALVADMTYVRQSAGRLVRALFEIVLRRGWADAARRALRLCQMVERRMWAVESPLRQFARTHLPLPAAVLRKLEKTHLPWEALLELDAHQLGELVRVPKLGKRVYKLVHQVPRLELAAHVQPITRALLRVELTLTPDFEFDRDVHGEAEAFFIFVEDVNSERILHHEHFVLRRRFATEPHMLEFAVPIAEPQSPHYFIRVLSERWIGADALLPLSFRHLLLPNRYAPPTELLDLQPLPVKELSTEYAALYADEPFRFFNAVQTQCFDKLYGSDASALVCAPTGSGKSICAEFAILRMLSTSPRGRAVYLSPRLDLLERGERALRKRFGDLQIRIERLHDREPAANLALLARSQIVLTTPAQWDEVSRRWRTRAGAVVANVNLVVLDDLHMVGAEDGPLLEIVVSRMRYIAAQTKNPIRFVALSASVANASDLGAWIGASPAVFAFAPSVRAVPLDLNIIGLDLYEHDARQHAMLRPAYAVVREQPEASPVLVFVPSREQARRVAAGFVALAAAEEPKRTLLHVDVADMRERYLDGVTNTALRESLLGGVGFIHAGLSARERRVVRELFVAGAIQLLVVERSLVFEVAPVAAPLVLVLGTDGWNGVQQRDADYSIAELEAMLGAAGRQGQDVRARATIFCHRPKRAFLQKFLLDAYPVESHVDHVLADHLNAEIVHGTVRNVQDAVDYLTWTLLYRRIAQNPNYYNLRGTSHRHLSDYLSELVEGALDDLQSADCISLDEQDMSVAPLNLGMIASHYCLRYLTVELFAHSISAQTRIKGLLGLLSSASEFDTLPVRRGEDRALDFVLRRVPLAPPSAPDVNLHEPHTKAHLLLQAHFSRLSLSADVAQEQARAVLPTALRLLSAMVDVISSAGWLEPAIQAMELVQMLVQGLWADRDSQLLQLPHFTREMAQRCKDANVNTIFDFMDLEDDQRNKLCPLPPKQLRDVANVCNRYPNLDVEYEVEEPDAIRSGESFTVRVSIERDEDEEDEEENAAKTVPEAYAPRFPEKKNEGWWLVIGVPASNKLLCIKRFSMRSLKQDVKLQLVAPDAGKHSLQLVLMSDAYIGCDQEYAFDVVVAEGEAASEDEDMSSADEEQSDEAMETA